MDREVHQVLMMKEDEVNEMGTVGRWSVTKEEVVVTEEIMEQVFVEQTQVIEMRETTVEEQCWSIDQTGEVVEDQTGEVVVTQEVWISQKPVVEVSEMVEEQWFIEKGEVVTTTDEKVEQGVFMMTTEDVEQVSTNTVVGVVMGERWSVEKGEAIVTEEVGLQEEVFGVQEMVEEHWSSLEKGNGEVNDQVLVEKKQVHVEVNGVVMEERRSVEKGEVIITEEVEQAAVLEKKGVLEVNAIMVSGQLSLGLGNEEVVVGETVSEPRPLGEEVFLNYTKTIYGRWKKQLGQEIADGESEDGIVGNYYMWNTRESCEARVEYEKAVRKYLSHTTHCSKCVEKRQPISVIIIVIIRFILQFVHHLVISSGLTEHRLIRRTWTILEQSYEIVVTRRAYVFIIKKPGVLISRTLSVLKQSYEWVVTMKVYVSVKQILTKILVKKVHPNPPRPLTGVIPSVDHPSTPTGVTPSPLTGVIPSVDHPSTPTGVNTIITEHVPKQSYESVVVVVTRLYVFLHKKQELLYKLLLKLWMEVTNNPSRRLFLFGVFSVLLCLIGTQFMVNQDYQIASVDHPSTTTGVTPSPPTGVIPSVDHPSTPPGVIPSPPMGVIPSVDHPSTPTGVTPIPTMGVVPSVDHPSTPPGVTPSPPTGVIPSGDHPSTPTGVTPSPPTGVIPSIDHPSTPTDVETWIQINKVNFIAGISILLYIAIRKLPTTSSRIVMVVRTKLQLVLWTTIHVTTRVQTELLRIWLAIKLVKVLNVCKVLVQAATKLLQWFRDFVSKEEILKSIVYGGLTEIIASISVVAFFSDFDTTILNVIAFALAGLIGGCFFFVTNIWGLKKGGGNSYTEQLGRVNYFPFHATLATLSFIIFGMIPPSTFVFSFIKTNDKKLAIWVVSAVSLLCLSLLAIFKAYVITSITYRFKYVRTVLWYQVIALGVSICSYLASKMVKGSIEDIGLFNTSTCDAMSMSRHN